MYFLIRPLQQVSLPFASTMEARECDKMKDEYPNACRFLPWILASSPMRLNTKNMFNILNMAGLDDLSVCN